MMQAYRRIIHVDMDAFYASVEQRDNPALRGQPVAVGSAGRRGVVAAASYEARRYGVRSAMPSVTAQRKCPELVFVPPRFEVYRAVSAQVQAIFSRFTSLIQPLSLDEAYLDVTHPLLPYPSATAIATAIRNQIHAETGLTASAGVSYNKFLAKLASDYRKPNGQFVITPDMGADFVADLPVGAFHGIGPATAARMNALGIRTGLDLRDQPLSRLLRHFGKAAGFYHGIARGIDERPVEVNRPRRSIGAEKTFDADIHDWQAAQASIHDLAHRVWNRCAARDLTGVTVTVKVKYNDFRQIVRGRTGPDVVRDDADLRQRAALLFAPCFPPRRGIRLMGITVSGLRAAGGVPAPQQLALFG